MRVAFINQPWNRITPPIRTGSVAIWTYHVANRLAGRHSVALYGRGKASSFRPVVSVHRGVEYREVSISMDSGIERLINRVSHVAAWFEPFFSSRAYYALYALQVAIDLRARGCDIVHIQNFSQFAPIIRAFNPSARIVLHMHCEWLTQLNRTIIEQRLKSVDAIVGCSDYITDSIRSAFPGLEDRCHTIPNGVDTAEFCPINKGRIGRKLLFIGRISPEKGLDVLIDAFALLAAKDPEATLDLVGPDAATPMEFLVGLSREAQVVGLRSMYSCDYLSHLRARVPEWLIRRVRFRGSLPHDQLRDEYRRAAIVVNPSFSESFGMSVIEAMACGTPVVTSRVGGMIEVVSGVGCMTECGDAQALAEAMLGVLGNPRKAAQMAAQGRSRVLERYSWNRVGQTVERVYTSVYEDCETTTLQDGARKSATVLSS